jgi:hypothetical protein
MTGLVRKPFRASRLTVALSAGVALMAGLAVAAPAAASSPAGVRPAHPSMQHGYAVVRPECPAARHGWLTCYAMRVVPAYRTTAGARPLVATARSVPRGPAGGYTPADLATAYGYDAATPVVQTVAIVDAYDDPNAATDLQHFDAHYGIPYHPAGFEKVGQNGGTAPAALPAKDRRGWSEEESLDIDAVRSVCQTCKILLVEANTPSNANLSAAAATAIRLGATEVSNSYGGPERGNPMSATQAARYEHPGVVVTASTGDQGWYGWGFASESRRGRSQNSPSEPATLSGVVAVGGTTLRLTGVGRRSSETVWDGYGPRDRNFPQGGASGGGCSLKIAAPAWQRDVAGYAKTGCGRKRLAADISADADPNTGIDVYDSYDCGPACEFTKGHAPPKWEQVGGTSLSSPLIAAMWALAGGAGASSQPAETLYQRYAAAGHPGVYDVTRGGNGFCDALTQSQCTRHGRDAVNRPNAYGRVDCRFTDSPGNVVVPEHSQCLAGKGYDGPSGIGAPIGLTVFTAASPA